MEVPVLRDGGGAGLGIKRVADAAKEVLGENTIIFVSSDNGGSVWFGGLNEPLRSGKHTLFEGGVRVPAFAVDLSGGKYLGRGGREFKGMVHISDWLPTFLSFARSSHLYQDIDMDGVDQSKALATGKRVRLETFSFLTDMNTQIKYNCYSFIFHHSLQKNEQQSMNHVYLIGPGLLLLQYS